MDLRHNQITIQELLADPRAWGSAGRRFPRRLTGPLWPSPGL